MTVHIITEQPAGYHVGCDTSVLSHHVHVTWPDVRIRRWRWRRLPGQWPQLEFEISTFVSVISLRILLYMWWRDLSTSPNQKHDVYLNLTELSQHEIENWTLRNVKFKRVSGLQNIYSCEWFEFPSKKKKKTSVFMILGCGWSRHIHSCVCGKKKTKKTGILSQNMTPERKHSVVIT